MKRPHRIPDASEITDETPLLLEVAARLAFPDGSVSGLALRNAAGRGELGYERIGGRIYTTLAAIGEMREACRRKPKPRRAEASVLPAISDQEPEPSPTKEDFEAARASALLVVERLLAEHKAKSPSGRRKARRPA
ncbi:hypothetical protein [Methylobacterium sp. WL6]|uniref:hypothetical protein n=1 Tax=Methylobacterium sp. WL6 TaxID=2603901 RepID=UPI0011C96778|nr:hypothetical protein [Methylobacterium sp. WL6]TXN73402.1 hypothetical protein FV230_01120 [Methylobacterium sp. WL6]